MATADIFVAFIAFPASEKVRDLVKEDNKFPFAF